MKSTKLFIIFIFLFTFSLQISAQDEMPRIVWKNLQEKYENFYSVKPIIINQSDQPIYIDCTLNDFEKLKLSGYVENSDNTKLLYFDEETNQWNWNVMICGTDSKEERQELKKKYKEIEKLKKENKYVPSGCKINPNEEFALNFNDEQWAKLSIGDGIGPKYKFGKFKFEINYWWYISQKNNGQNISESPEFLIEPKNETK